MRSQSDIVIAYDSNTIIHQGADPARSKMIPISGAETRSLEWQGATKGRLCPQLLGRRLVFFLASLQISAAEEIGCQASRETS